LSPASISPYSTPRCNVFQVGPVAGGAAVASNDDKNAISTRPDYDRNLSPVELRHRCNL
jgi:hypothetical protein